MFEIEATIIRCNSFIGNDDKLGIVLYVISIVAVMDLWVWFGDFLHRVV